MINIFTAIGIWIILLPTVYGAGKICAANKLPVENSLMRGICFVALGLSALGYFVIAVGTFNVLRLEVVLGGVFLMFLFSLRFINEFAVWLCDIIKYLFLRSTDRFATIVRWIFAGSILLSLLSLLVPEIANDSLAYHITLPKLFIQNHSIMPLSYDEKSYRSLFMEQLFIIPMFFKNIPAVILFHWFTSFFLVTALVIWIEEEAKSYSWALFLGVLLWLTPTLFNQISISYTDGSVAFFAMLSVYLAGLGWSRTESKSYFWFAGLLMGISIGCKLLSVMMAVAVAAAFLFLLVVRKGDKKRLFYGALIFAAALIVACGYWFVRNLVLTGDILFPLITKKFGTTGLYADQKFSTIGVAKNLWNFIFLPVRITFSPDLFNRYHWVGPAYLCLTPFFYWTAFKVRKSLPVAIIAFLSTLFWFLSAQDIRFLLAALPLWLWVASHSLVPLIRSFPDWLRKVAQSVVIIGLLGYLSLGVYHYRVQAQSVIQHWDDAVFLTRMERSYPAAVWVNSNLPVSARILNAWEVRTYYFDRQMIDSSMYLRIHRKLKSASPNEIHQILKNDGFTHVMRSHAVGAAEQLRRPNIYTALDRALSDGRLFKRIQRIDSANIREDKYYYDVYELKIS